MHGHGKCSVKVTKSGVFPLTAPEVAASFCYCRSMPSPRRFPPPWSVEEPEEGLSS
jgi:hypothetical protein